jgi:hypothetical protein
MLPTKFVIDEAWAANITEFCSQRLLLRTFAAGRRLRGCAFPTISGLGEHDDLHEPSSAVMAARRAVVESLPATTLTEETAAAWQQTTCPICLHVSTHTCLSCYLPSDRY